MNQIVDRQNQEKYLKIQYSARTCFNIAEALSVFTWILVITNICVDMLMSDNDNIKVYLVAFFAIAVFAIQGIINKVTQYAAAFRMYFDYEMFGWKSPLYQNITEKEVYEKSDLIVRIRKRDSHIRMKNNGKQKTRGVKDWYDYIDKLPNGDELINECQQQNMWWTKKISSIQDIIFSVIILALLASILIRFYHYQVSDLMAFLFSMVALFINLVIEIKRNRQHKDLVKNFEHHNKCINNHESITMSDLKELQELIDERRKVPAVALNIVHDKGSGFLHKMYRSRREEC